MIEMKITGLKEVISDYSHAGRHLPFAFEKAINNLAFLVRDAEMEIAAKVFDRPKPQTVKNFWVSKAKRKQGRLHAELWFDQIYDKNYDQYMVPEVEGGPRAMKRSEKLLGHYYMPGAGAKLDRFGNMSGSQLTQVLSQLQKFGEVGHGMNQTAKSKARSRGAKKSTEYFVVNNQHGKLPPGVYQRTQSGVGFGAATSRALPAGSFQRGRSSGKYASVVRGRGLLPVMLFTNQPNYKPRFPFYQVAQAVTDRHFQRLMHEAVDYALRTAR